jgi:hypothetical protein
MKLNILQDGTYSVIKKTYWLRLVQRHWKKIMKMKKDIYNKRMSVISQYSLQIRGRYPYGLNTMPGFTATSVFPKMWAATGVGYTDVISNLLKCALTRTNGVLGN